MVVETERLLIRKWNDEDAAAVADIYLKPEVMEFIPGGVWTLERTARIIARMRELDVEQGYGFYPVVVKSLGTIIGHCGLGQLERTPEIEVAFVLDSPYWGKGYASEAARAMLAHGFTKPNISHIVAVAFPEKRSLDRRHALDRHDAHWTRTSLRTNRGQVRSDCRLE
ncbi:MAG: GNAT family N-acetyltransferase [Candidatus Cybelea sp.]